MIHWDHKKKIRRQFAQLGVIVFALLTLIVYDHRALTGEVALSKLNVLASYKVPVKELSGLAVIPGSGEDTSLIGIGDADSLFARITLNHEGFVSNQIDFSLPMIRGFSICRSSASGRCKKFNKALTTDWEGIAADGAGHLALLQEFSSSVVVIESRTLKALARIHLDFSDVGMAVATKNSRLAENTLGEGIVLLKNGHILVAKERFPAAIVEFGPTGNLAGGVGPKTILGHGEFQFQKGDVNYEPLHVWQRNPASKCDISDLAAGPGGSLYVLSENCRRIVHYENGLSTNTHTLEKEAGWLVPKKIKNPEALAILPQGLLIGSDIKSGQANLHLVSPRPVKL